MKYVIKQYVKGKLIHSSRVATSRAEALRWLPTWKKNVFNPRGTRTVLTKHVPKKRRKADNSLFSNTRNYYRW